MFEANELVEFCKSMVGQPYWYGTYGNPCTESKLQQKKKQYPSHYTTSRMATYRKHIATGKVCMDCIGLIKAFFWTNGGKGVKDYLSSKKSYKNTYASNGFPDRSADGTLSWLKSKGCKNGKISTLPEQPGILLFSAGHVGVYIGNGYAIEARGFAYGVVKTKVASRKWTSWAYLPSNLISYNGKIETPTCRVLKNGRRGDDVKELQETLIKLGYNCGKSGADGVFGDDTEKAVRAFQKDRKLTVDGEFGPKSFAALEEPTRKVLIVNGNCFVRSQPATSGSSMGVAKKGESYNFAGATTDNGWNKIVFKNKEGWVSGKYSKIV